MKLFAFLVLTLSWISSLFSGRYVHKNIIDNESKNSKKKLHGYFNFCTKVHSDV